MFSSQNSQVSQDAVFIEDVMSTFLYAGNGSTQTITNGIDLAGKGGLVWLKNRTSDYGNFLFDTARGVTKALTSNGTNAQFTENGGVSSFGSTGFGLGNSNDAAFNGTGNNYASWTFREQPKFFDVVTWTGNSTSGRTIAHSLGSAPGCVIIKSTSDAFDWYVYHQSLGAAQFLNLNSTSAATSSEAMFGPGNPAPSSTVITLGNSNATNGTGKTYVAYVFAHNAGGFGLTGTDNVISCGSFTTSGSGVGTIDLGYEPQWLLVKTSSTAGNWLLFDTMRGLPNNGTGTGVQTLYPNNSDAEATGQQICDISATGVAKFIGVGANTTCIYIAIRRGPMKVPTDATKVFSPVSTSAAINSTTPVTLTPEASDWWMNRSTGTSSSMLALTRLTGWGYLNTTSTAAEDTSSYIWTQKTQSDLFPNSAFRTAVANIRYFFKRAPGFFDVVCYTGTGSAQTLTHNLGVVPEMMIVKERTNDTGGWFVYAASLGATQYINIDTGGSSTSSAVWNNTEPTSSAFTVGSLDDVSGSGDTYVAYLFATCPGVSKVGSYTGTGTTQQINCGFTAGARFVLIKKTSGTGSWYVWDSARGIVSGNDPYLLLNSTAAEVTNTDYVDAYSAGFEISSTAPSEINENGGSFIFLAIA